jgi:hypothetical protein
VTANEELDEGTPQDSRPDNILLSKEHDNIVKGSIINMLPDGNINMANLNSKPPMATTQVHTPTLPHLLHTMNHQHNPKPGASLDINQGALPLPGHSRHASLDPSTAYGPPSEREREFERRFWTSARRLSIRRNEDDLGAHNAPREHLTTILHHHTSPDQ